jgi:hypothetical protein
MGAFIAFLRQIAGCSRATAPEPKINQRVGKRHNAAARDRIQAVLGRQG